MCLKDEGACTKPVRLRMKAYWKPKNYAVSLSQKTLTHLSRSRARNGATSAATRGGAGSRQSSDAPTALRAVTPHRRRRRRRRQRRAPEKSETARRHTSIVAVDVVGGGGGGRPGTSSRMEKLQLPDGTASPPQPPRPRLTATHFPFLDVMNMSPERGVVVKTSFTRRADISGNKGCRMPTAMQLTWVADSDAG